MLMMKFIRHSGSTTTQYNAKQRKEAMKEKRKDKKRYMHTNQLS